MGDKIVVLEKDCNGSYMLVRQLLLFQVRFRESVLLRTWDVFRFAKRVVAVSGHRAAEDPYKLLSVGRSLFSKRRSFSVLFL